MLCWSRRHITHPVPAFLSEPDCVIVYCTEKAQTEKLAEVLKSNFNLAADFFHSQVSDMDKRRKLEKFKLNEIDVMCSTTAFGMGIDKRNVRAVIHFTMSYSLMNYYQESSRAGRDGKPAYCILFHHVHDAPLIRNVLLRSKTGHQQAVARKKFRTMVQYCREAKHCRHIVIQQQVLHVPVGNESLFAHMDEDLLSSPGGVITCCDNCWSRHNGADVKLLLPMSDIKKCFREVLDDQQNYSPAAHVEECVRKLMQPHWESAFPESNTSAVDEYTIRQVTMALVDREVIVRGRTKTKQQGFSRG